MRAVAAAYVRFATRDAALLELMFASKHREESGVLHEAADRAFSALLELIEQGQAEGALERGDPERVGLVLFATIQGIATLVPRGHGAAGQLDELVHDAIAHFLRGSRAALQRVHVVEVDAAAGQLDRGDQDRAGADRVDVHVPVGLVLDQWLPPSARVGAARRSGRAEVARSCGSSGMSIQRPRSSGR